MAVATVTSFRHELMPQDLEDDVLSATACGWPSVNDSKTGNTSLSNISLVTEHATPDILHLLPLKI
jgi:hypothetical protein